MNLDLVVCDAFIASFRQINMLITATALIHYRNASRDTENT